jgi:hypothetical protein
VKYIVLSLVFGIILSIFLSIIGLIFINEETIKYWNDISSNDRTIYLIQTGAVIGAIFGFIFGIVIGSTIAFYKLWNFAEKQRLNAVTNPV